jgi:mono/diheme cytochrome c family protein
MGRNAPCDSLLTRGKRIVKRIFKWLGVGVGSLVALVVVTAITVYLLSEHEVKRLYTEVQLRDIPVPTDADSILKGKRLATIYGCFNSCHGDRMQGLKLYDEPGIARINAPNLTRVVREYSNAELERLIRHGVKRDGTSTWIMPSQMFQHLTDEDLGKVIAFVRSVPEVEGFDRELTLGPLGRIGIVTGKFKPLASTIDPSQVHASLTDRSDPMAFGKYMVMTTCTECHGQKLQGDAFLKSPPLAVLAGYSDESFRRLMKTGIAIGGRKLGLMTEAGETRFPSLTDEELEAMRVYLRSLYGETALARTHSDVKPTVSRVEISGMDEG